MDDLLRERGYRWDFPLKLVKYGQYSPRLSKKIPLDPTSARYGPHSRTAS